MRSLGNTSIAATRSSAKFGDAAAPSLSRPDRSPSTGGFTRTGAELVNHQPVNHQPPASSKTQIPPNSRKLIFPRPGIRSIRRWAFRRAYGYPSIRPRDAYRAISSESPISLVASP